MINVSEPIWMIVLRSVSSLCARTSVGHAAALWQQREQRLFGSQQRQSPQNMVGW
jgi:hypothetical protein